MHAIESKEKQHEHDEAEWKGGAEAHRSEKAEAAQDCLKEQQWERGK